MPKSELGAVEKPIGNLTFAQIKAAAATAAAGSYAICVEPVTAAGGE